MSFPRYPQYKDSGVDWLGQVPAHWEVVQLKQFVDIQNGADHKHVEQDDGYPVIGSGGAFTYASDFLYDGESVLLGRKGTIDKPLHVTGRFWTVDTMYWTKIRPNASGRYAYYTALTIPFGYYSTNTALPSMTKGALNAHFVARPPLPEQREIAGFLDRETAQIDALVAEQERLLELLKEKRQAVISHAVTRGLNPNAPLKPSGLAWLGDVPAHWTVASVRRLVRRIEQGWSPECYGRPAEADEWGVVKTGCVNRGTYVEGENKALPETLDPLPEYEIHVGDVLMSRASGSPELVGSTALIRATRPKLMLSDKIFRIYTEDHVESAYFVWLFNSAELRSQIEQSISGADGLANNLPQSALKGFYCTLPPLTEQRAIVAHLDAATAQFDALTAEVERALALLQERRTALISAAVTGQIDVRDAT